MPTNPFPPLPINPVWNSLTAPTEGFESQHATIDETESVFPGQMLKLKIKEEKPISDTNWMEQLVLDCYRLPNPPKVEPKFIEGFIKNGHLTHINPEFPFIDPKTHVGIEVEVENVNYINPNIPLCFWQIDEDGSLRNHGKEFKSYAIPLKHAQIALEQLFNGLNPDIDFSSRTSIHVHMDIRGLTINQLLTLLFVYTVMENLLFKFAGNNRRNNIFCTPISETNLMSDLNIRSRKALQLHFQHTWQKYSALNVVPIHTFGTVEFRQMPGNKDVTKLCIWLDLLSRIKLFAYRNSLSDVLETISSLNTNSQYRKFVESVFGNLTAYLDTTTLLNDMEKAVYICKNCQAINEFHQQVIAEMDKRNVNSMLVKIIGVTRHPSEVLNPKNYAFLQDMMLKTGNIDATNLYNEIRQHPDAYISSFRIPEYVNLIKYIATHSL